MLKKTCTKCGLEKDIELFVTKGKSPDGHASECKECHNKRHRARYYENLELNRVKGRERSKKHIKEHPEKKAAAYQRYKKKHPEKIKQHNANYYRNNKEIEKEKNRAYKTKNRDKIRIWRKQHYEKHRDKMLKKTKEWTLKNKERIEEYKKQYYKGHLDEIREYKNKRYLRIAEQEKQRVKAYRETHKEEMNAKRRERVKNTPQIKMAHSLRTRIGRALKKKSCGGRLKLLLGCDIDFFVKHIEDHFEEGMTWANYGIGVGKEKWSLDHRIPIVSFDLSDEEQLKKAFHWSNTFPMWYSENCAKCSNYEGKRYYLKAS